ncbi:MAG: extracellular solute-binding protein [Actinobacteria bacterium]|nr:extracellular solute-binding protein [Actinomycetota bacterium]
MSISRRLRVVAGLVVAALAAVAASAGTSATNQSAKLVIWADADRVPAVTQVANAWAASKGVTVQVVQKDFGSIRSQMTTVAADTAPDVIVGAHDWIGELSANGSIVPLSPSAATKKQFPAYALNSFSYGTAIKKLFGAPVALENVALFTNTKLAKVPTSFADLERQALAAKKKTKAPVGLAVQQGAGGDAYHMYPFFSGLGGYIFGTNKAGNLDPSDIGLANPKFLRNAKLIDKWNTEGLIRSQVAWDTGRDLFTKGKVAYYITGPWFLGDVQKSGVKYAISGFPQIVPGLRSTPFLGVQGFMVTKFSSAHGVESLAKDLVANYMMRPASQLALALSNGRFPANTVAGAQVKDKDLKAFGKASVGGVPMPNIPQMASVWQDLGAAWARSTKGAGAIAARKSFVGAQKSIAQKIG